MVIKNEAKLDDLLSRPAPELIGLMQRLDGEIMILGIAGKMGISLGRMAMRAIAEAGVKKRVIGVSRFSNLDAQALSEGYGMETIRCDLLDAGAVAALPRVKNILFMAGRKFGTQGDEELTWAINTLAPGNVAVHFSESRIAAFSTGNVYPLAPPASGGCIETDPVGPVGEYAQSCLGRERVFQYYSRARGTPVCLIRLNYAMDLRYGVLHDLARKVWRDEPVNIAVGQFNCIWQGDANHQALMAFEHCQTPANILNVTGPELVSVRYAASTFAGLMGKSVVFAGEDSGAALLSNPAKAISLFGYPRVSLLRMLEWTAQWVMAGGPSLDKPTHFEETGGRY